VISMQSVTYILCIGMRTLCDSVTQGYGHRSPLTLALTLVTYTNKKACQGRCAGFAVRLLSQVGVLRADVSEGWQGLLGSLFG